MASPINPCDNIAPEPCGVNPAFTYTRYPCDFDDPRPTIDSRGLPVVVDLQTPVKGEVVNRHREAILALEAEIGIQPSGIYTTVRARLDALESTLCTIYRNVGANTMRQEVFTATPGQTVFVLSYPPVDEQSTEVFIDGVSQTVGVDYTVSGSTVTYNNSPPLTGGEVVVIKYFESVSVTAAITTGLVVSEEGAPVEVQVTEIDFVGSFVTATGSGTGTATVTFTAPLLSEILSSGNSTGGFDIDFTGGSEIISTSSVPFTISGTQRLLVDSTGIVVNGLVESDAFVTTLTSSVPGGLPSAGKATIWVRDTDGYVVVTYDDGDELVLFGGGGGGGVTNHGLLTGLLDDDHVQYLLIDGTRAMTGTLDTVGINVTGDGYISNDFVIGGKLTVGGLIDPTGVVFDLQASVPGGTPAANKATIWIRSDGYAIVTDELGIDRPLIFEGGAGTSDHGTLTGLLDDDHPQYLLVDGTRAMTGTLDMGSNLISNVSDPVASTDAATKSYVDGYVFSELANLDHGSLIGLGDDDHVQYLLVDGTRAMTGTLDMGTNLISNVVDPVSAQDAATKNYVDGYVFSELASLDHGSLLGLGDDDHTQYLLVDGTRAMTGTLDMGSNLISNVSDPLSAQDAATKAYVDGYIGATGSGYLGVDVFVESSADFPAAIGGVITLVANTVYGIDGQIDIGTDRIVMSSGSKMVGGGGSSTTSEILSSNASALVTIGVANASIEGLTLTNNSGSALILSSGASNYSIVDTTFVGTLSAISISGSGQGQIIDSFITVPSGGSGILVDEDTTSFLVRNTRFSGPVSGDGYGVNFEASSGSKTVSQVGITSCVFEDMNYAIRQNSDVEIDGNLAIVACEGFELDTFIRTELGSVTQAAVVSSNFVWNASLFVVGLVPGGNHVFRGNLSQGVAQTESPIV